MSNRSARLGAWTHTRIYSPKLQPMMQDVLRRLADIDFEHDAALDRLEETTHDPVLKSQLAERLKSRHRERREPYLRQLADLQAQASRKVGLPAI